MIDRRKKPRELAEAEMDMTPMIDVTFLLLIFFLCLDFKTLESKLSANLPKTIGPSRDIAIPQDKLDIRIEAVHWGQELPDPMGRDRYVLAGHEVKWYVGAQPLRDGDRLSQLLRREARIRTFQRETQRTEVRPITIHTGPGVTYGDVTWLIDQATASGFERITFGGGGGRR